jgi:cobalt-precorrin 5A hydrolase
VIAAGIGCRRGTPAADIEAAIRAALAHAHLDVDALDVIATIAAKESETGIRGVVQAFRVSLIVVPERELVAANDRIETHSTRVAAVAGVGSVAEAAALAAAGPRSTLIVPRLTVGAATCALASAPPESTS